MPPKSSRASATPSAALDSETPARNTRARSKTPLPAIDPKQSHAYGAQGKATLNSQIRSQSTNFADAFSGARSVEEDVEPPPTQQDRSRHRTPRQPTIHEESESEMTARRAATPARRQPTFAGRNATALDAGADYAGVTTRLRAEMRRRVNDPSSLMWYLVLAVFFVSFLLGFSFHHIPLSDRMTHARGSITTGMDIAFGNVPFDREPEHLARLWYRFKHDEIIRAEFDSRDFDNKQYAVNINLLARLERVEKRVTTVEEALALEEEDIADLRRTLPQNVVLEKIEDEWAIPPVFWEALQARLAEDTDVAPLWRSWVLRNDEEAASLQAKYVDAAVDRELEDRQFVSQDEFLQKLKENNDKLMAAHHEEVLRIWKRNEDHVVKLARRTVDDALENTPPSTLRQLDALVQAVEIQNRHEALRKVNWFSPGTGARVDPHFTSFTQEHRRRDWVASLWQSVTPLILPPNPPIMALTSWDEAGDCWCANLSAGNTTQISVLANTYIHPESLIIEHIPAGGTPSIMAAPKDLELWAHMGTADEAKRYQEIIHEEAPYSMTHPCSESPGPEWLCIWAGKYDIHGYNYVQTNNVFMNTRDIGLSSNKYIVRSTSNWGSPWTCYYRLRLTGQRANEGDTAGDFIRWKEQQDLNSR